MGLSPKKMSGIVIVVGPTSSGKTAYAIELAKKIGGEIISADSRQVYRGMDIGTGKVTREEMQGIPHHLIDVADPKTETFTAEDFVRLADAAIEDITARGKVPIVCGGTGFYVDALVGIRSMPKVPRDDEYREELEKKTTDELFALLQKADPRRAADIDAKNPRRLVRALEIARHLGAVPEVKDELRYQAEWFGMHWPKEVLQERIHKRLMERIEQGMVGEAEHLHRRGLTFTRMESLGLEYKWLAKLLKKEIDEKTFVEELERDIVRYSKRQMTWWRRNENINWVTNVK